MKKSLRGLFAAFLVVLLILQIVPFSTAAETPVIKNIIYMIPDGGGFALYDFAGAVKEEGGFEAGLYPNSTQVVQGPMNLKPYLIGTEITRSASSSVTDSAAAGTALSSGYKTKNGYVGVDANGVVKASILEAAQLAGKRTGITTISDWTHATPASFTAHNTSRENYEPMSEQIVNQGLDVVLGSGFGAAKWGSIKEAENRGYTIINNKTELAAVKSGQKIWGNVASGASPIDIKLKSTQPTLAQMTEAAIRALDGSEAGFFLMVEGSSIDSGGHLNDLVTATSEYLAFDAAFKVALDYAKGRTDTIVIAAPDHDTGGLNLPNADEVGGSTNAAGYADAVAEVRKGINSKAGISWTSGNHSDRRGGVWLYKPDGVPTIPGLSEMPGDTPETRKLIIENTDISHYIESVSGLDMKYATEQLYVDVTNRGSYQTETKTFTFRDADIQIKANQSVAMVGGIFTDLKGEIAVYSSGKFYVPAKLITAAEPTANAADAPIRIFIDGKQLELDVSPQIVSGRTLVPFRKIFETLGAEVAWQDSTKTAVGMKDNILVQLTLDSTEAKVNGISVTLDVPATIIDSRLLVPARFVAENLGCRVEWDAANRSVIITTKQ